MEVSLLHVASTWALVGFIWSIQLIQYPAFALVGGKELPAYHAHHCRRITWIVAPLMAAELLSCIALLSSPPPGLASAWLWTGAGLIAFNWLTTGLLFVPLHAALVGRDRVRLQERLVSLNWLRTISWSLRGLLVLPLLT